MKIPRLIGLALATAAAGIFAAAGIAPASAAKHEAEQAKVRCDGINACSGKAECKTATNECAGQNACKGKGWVTVSAKECQDKGGKPL
jgi:uncharacterized membrane protein